MRAFRSSALGTLAFAACLFLFSASQGQTYSKAIVRSNLAWAVSQNFDRALYLIESAANAAKRGLRHRFTPLARP